MPRRIYECTQIVDERGNVLSETVREGEVDDQSSEIHIQTRYAVCENCGNPIMTAATDFRGSCDAMIGGPPMR